MLWNFLFVSWSPEHERKFARAISIRFLVKSGNLLPRGRKSPDLTETPCWNFPHQGELVYGFACPGPSGMEQTFPPLRTQPNIFWPGGLPPPLDHLRVEKLQTAKSRPSDNHWTDAGRPSSRYHINFGGEVLWIMKAHHRNMFGRKIPNLLWMRLLQLPFK